MTVVIILSLHLPLTREQGHTSQRVLESSAQYCTSNAWPCLGPGIGHGQGRCEHSLFILNQGHKKQGKKLHIHTKILISHTRNDPSLEFELKPTLPLATYIRQARRKGLSQQGRDAGLGTWDLDGAALTAHAPQGALVLYPAYPHLPLPHGSCWS